MSAEKSHKRDLLPILQAEYQALKQEQTSRIGIRENALYTNFLAVAGIATIAFSQKPVELLVLLAIPLSSCCIYAVYLNQDITITNLRRFFAEDFPKRVIAALDLPDDEAVKREFTSIIASWETIHRSTGSHRHIRKILHTVFVLLTFLGASAAALYTTYGLATSGGYMLRGFWMLDCCLVITMVIALIITADI